MCDRHEGFIRVLDEGRLALDLADAVDQPFPLDFQHAGDLCQFVDAGARRAAAQDVIDEGSIDPGHLLATAKSWLLVPKLVAQAAAMFSEHLEDPISIGDVADVLGVTPRQVERAFKKATGQSPSHFYRALRMKAARPLVLYSKDSVSDVAGAVGFTSSAPLVKHYAAMFGVSPQEDRKRINAFRVQGNVPVPSI